MMSCDASRARVRSRWAVWTGAAALAGLVLAVASAGAQDAQTPANSAKKPADSPKKKVFAPVVQMAAAKPGVANMALKKVVLFSSGVGFFEHNGQVTDDAQVDMKFKTDDINDLLKSLVVQDLGGGQVSTVSYGSKDPISKTLKSFAIDLTTNPTLGQLLEQVRGEKVAIEAPNQITGVILGVETRDQKVGDEQVQKVEFLNLLTDAGLRSVALDKVSALKLVNEKLDGELRGALALLASSHDMDKKTVTISFVGQGKRDVRMGYIQETPIWKTAYRLVLDDEKAPFLQGWAIVENTTEEDWKGVKLTLVSGRPISFVMDLYEPLYIPRPVEELELYASLRPQTYEQDLARKQAEFRKLAERGRGKGEGKEQAAGLAMRRARAAAPAAPMMDRAEKAGKKADKGWALQQGARSAATAQEVGEAFQYAIDTPVNLARQQSAMLQIVNAEIEGEKVSIYNPTVHPKHPLCGLRMTNSTELHLMQGPITVFDDGVYAGDAKIQDLPPGSERLISYAMDLNTEVAPESKGRPEQLLSVRLVKGTMYVSKKYARAQEYKVKNSGSKPKKVLIEQPFDSQWTLIAPKEPEEKTRNRYRFAVEAKPGEPATLLVEEERTESQQIGLSNVDDGTIRIYLSSKVVSDEVKAALTKVVELKRALQEIQVNKRQLEARIKVIEREQSRIRQKAGGSPEAEKSFLEAIRLQQSLAERFPTVARYQGELARSYFMLAYTRHRQGRTAEASDALGRAIGALESLPEDIPGGGMARFMLARAYLSHAEMLKKLGKHREAAEAEQKAKKLGVSPDHHPRGPFPFDRGRFSPHRHPGRERDRPPKPPQTP